MIIQVPPRAVSGRGNCLHRFFLIVGVTNAYYFAGGLIGSGEVGQLLECSLQPFWQGLEGWLFKMINKRWRLR
jgi:hypothetical protein